MEAPLSKITRIEFTDGEAYMYVDSWTRRRSARFIPGLSSFVDEFEGGAGQELFAVSLLSLRRETEMIFHIKTNEVQGIVVRRAKKQVRSDFYERVGFFNTGLVDGGSWHLSILKKAPSEKILVV